MAQDRRTEKQGRADGRGLLKFALLLIWPAGGGFFGRFPVERLAIKPNLVVQAGRMRNHRAALALR